MKAYTDIERGVFGFAKKQKPALLLLCLVVLPSFAMAQGDDSNRKPRKKWREILQLADSVRLQIRQSADRGEMLQWGDSILMAELDKSKMSDKKKNKFMKYYSRLQSRLASYDRKLFWGDSLLAAKYNKKSFDTAYITRPDARWTIKLRGNISNAVLETTARDAQGVEHNTRLHSEVRGTVSMAVAYRGMALGLAVNPAKLAGKSKDYEFNLNSYGNRFGFDIVYVASNTFRGRQNVGDVRYDIDKGYVSQKALNLNFYYAFNYRKFSFPAAFSQSYIQRRSAGSWMVGASFDGSETKVKGVSEGEAGGMALLSPMTIRMNEFAIGGGYGYNLVVGKHLLFHLSALPTFTVYSHDYTKTDAGKERMKYHFPSVIITGRGAALYSWRNKFLGATMVYNVSVVGDEEHLQLKRSKWRTRVFFGFRF